MAAIYDAMGNYAGEDNTGPGVRSAGGLDSNKPSATNNPSAPPPKASQAPSPTTKYAFQGLCSAMNDYEQQLVKDNVVEIANQYRVELVGEIQNATLVLPGSIDKTKTPMQSGETAKEKVDGRTNSVNNKGVNKGVVAGTQMIQFIEQTIRNSSYITDQQTATIDPVTGNSKPTTSATSSGSNSSTKWFKISVNVQPIGLNIDKKRNSFAYKITYIVSPYAINQSESQYFAPATYRGVHKVYNYWFTGDNTQVLNYEQNYSALYIDTLSGVTPDMETGLAASFPGLASPWQNTRVPTTAAAENSLGADKAANNPASTLADYLYNAADQGKVSLRIVGDPAWIQQGEVLGLNALSFNFNGFYPDGTVNTDAQQGTFALNWNAPADYNLATGLMAVNAGATGGNSNNLQAAQPAQSAAYQAVKVKSFFNHGKFEQELDGVLIKNLNQAQLQSLAQQGGAASSTAPTGPGVRSPLSATPSGSSATLTPAPVTASYNSDGTVNANDANAYGPG